ncbi:MAG: class I SAM-dependent methyltransferase, partial [Anaerolineales bacterium]|nr:class I SAM-dependent methyltransferase [Anaerolineales bacterium]
MTCPVCRADKFIPLGQKEDFRLVECRGCTHRFVHPMPTKEVIDAYYAKYWINEKNIRNGNRKIRKLKGILRPVFRKVPGKSFLDVGCNTGFGVEAARRLGFQASGIDLSAEAIEIAQRLYPENSFVAGTAQEFAEGGDSFDAILCREVIEHMPEVHSFMTALRSLMKIGGVLWLTTPDAGHFRVPHDFPRWKEVIPPEHVSFFNLTSLKRLFSGYGIEVLR